MLDAGTGFGEISLLTGEPRLATIRTLEESLLVEIDKSTLAPILEANPSLVDKLDEIVLERRRQTSGQLEKVRGSGMGEDARVSPRQDRPVLRPQGARLMAGAVGLLLGLDLTEVDRVAGVLERHGERFLARIFREGEIRRERRHKRAFAEHVAGRFAAKEAAMKALGLGWRGLAFRDIEVSRDTRGKPLARLSRQGARPGALPEGALGRGDDHARPRHRGGRRRARDRPRRPQELRPSAAATDVAWAKLRPR